MNPDLFLLELPEGEPASRFFATVGRALALSTHFESGCKALAALLCMQDRNVLESAEAMACLVMAAFAKRLNAAVSDVARRFPTTSSVEPTLQAARVSRNWVAHDSTLGFVHVLEHPELLDSALGAIAFHAPRIATGAQFVDYWFAVATNEEVPPGLIGYPSALVKWVINA
jgi:hypothetical protein